MTMRRSITLMLTTTCLAGAIQPALGQTVQPGTVAPSNTRDAEADTQTIVITATKRPQVLLDVPQSVSVVSGSALEAQHASSFQDYLKLVPGLQLDQSRPGEGRLIVRGVNTGGVASTVGVYVDETPFGSSSGLVNGAVLAGDFDTFDLGRIEVLRGPQGTLYGASSLSGVLRFVTNAPSTTSTLIRGRAGIESTHDGGVGYSANGVVNVPLGSTLAFRASGSYRKDAGFIDSVGTGGSDIAKDINGDRAFGGRASLLFKPVDTFSLRLTAIAQNIEANAPSVIEADPTTLKPIHGVQQSQFVPQFSDLRYRVYNATGTVGLGFAELTSSTSYSTQKQRERIDYTFAASDFLVAALGLPPNNFFETQDTNLRKFTQELRLSSHSTAVDWLVGGFYTNEHGLIRQDFVASLPGTLTPIELPAELGSARLGSRYREVAGFANATIHFGTRFDLDLGGRYSHNRQSSLQVSSGTLVPGDPLPKAHSSESVFTYSVAPKFKPNATTTLYARVAKGFRPGGPNVVPPGAPPEVATYHSDTVVNYEAGFKLETPDHHFSVDVAAFRIDWKNIQLVAVDPSGFGFNTNGSTAKSDGVEFTTTARPVHGLELSFNGAYTNARLTGPTPVVVGGRDGDRLPFTPRLSFAINGDYHWQIGSDAQAHVGASYRHLSRQIANYDNDFVSSAGRQRQVRAYGVFDLLGGISFDRFNIEIYARNLGNRRGVTSTTGLTVFGPSADTGFPIYPGGAIGTGIIRPRTIGVTLGFDL